MAQGKPANLTGQSDGGKLEGQIKTVAGQSWKDRKRQGKAGRTGRDRDRRKWTGQVETAIGQSWQDM